MTENDQRLIERLARADPSLARTLVPMFEAVERGDLSAARATLDGLAIAGEPTVARRLRMALEIALDAISVLQTTHAAETVTFSTQFGEAPDLAGLGLDNAKLQTIAKSILGAAQTTASQRWSCPACGGTGPRVGKAAMIGRGQPYGRLYLDFEHLLAPWRDTIHASDLQWDLVVAHIISRVKLNVPVARCTNCALFYVDWEYDPARIDRFYAGREVVDFQIDGQPVSGRGHAPDYVFTKLALPLHVERVLGDLKDRRLFDLGCAEGLMLEGFRRLGAQVSGGDPDVGKILYGQSVFGHALSSDPTALQHVEDGTLDILVSYHTVEHLVVVRPWLQTMVAKLKPGGHLVISVPCVTLRDDGLAVEMGGDH